MAGPGNAEGAGDGTAAVPAGLNILQENAYWLAVNKPAGLVCHPSKQGPESSLVGRVRRHLGPGPAHLINRLDRETSGVVLIAKDDGTARSLRRLWEQRRVHKEYWTLVHGLVETQSGEVLAALGRDDHSAVAIKGCVRPDGSPARTRFAVVRRLPRKEGWFTWVRVWPCSGRKHQIRIHLAWLGHPVVGDKIYGADERLYLDLVAGRLSAEQRRSLLVPHQALHARSLWFPWGHGAASFTAEPEPWFSTFLQGSTDSEPRR